ncbi:ABC transporter substrate-binding protein [Paenibacillus daejeonensis]|uniref:ABC transporter substrate-binding protein n=1 Tax=Paenibacillus daejeonensis TaxID=135193 RepID=UPI0003673D90|nr:extracellular solute-binding protein [Paenibacillus daejeonensis]
MSRRRYTMLLLGLVFLLIIFIPLLMLPGSLHQDAEGKDWSWEPDPDTEEELVLKTLNVTVSINENELAALQEVSERFAARFPGVEVNFRNLPYIEFYDQLKQEAVLGELPDIMLLDNSWVQEFAARGYLDPLDDLYTAESLADHPVSLLQPVKWNGYMWGMPLYADPYVTVWSRLLLAQGGLQEPPDGWEQLIALTEVLQLEEAAEGAIRPWLAGDNDSKVWLAWLAALVHDSSNEEIAAPSNLPETLWQFLYGSNAQGRFRLTDNADLHDIATDLHQGNLLSSVMRWSEYVEISREAGGTSWMLSLQEERLFGAEGSSYVVSDRTNDKELAHAWVAAAASPEVQQAAWSNRGTLPARSSLNATEVNKGSILPSWLPNALSHPSVWTPGPLSHIELDDIHALWLQWDSGAEIEEEYRASLEAILLPERRLP